MLSEKKLIRTSSSSSNPQLSPVQDSRSERRRPQSTATSCRRVSSLDSLSSECNPCLHPQKDFCRSAPDQIYKRRQSECGKPVEGTARPLSIASSAGMDNEAFSLEEIVVPDTLSVGEDSVVMAREETPRVSELQQEILLSPLFQKLKKVHDGSPSGLLIPRNALREIQDSKFPEDPSHSVAEETVSSSQHRLLPGARQKLKRSNNPMVGRESENQWRVHARQMSPSPLHLPPPPPPPPQPPFQSGNLILRKGKVAILATFMLLSYIPYFNSVFHISLTSVLRSGIFCVCL